VTIWEKHYMPRLFHAVLVDDTDRRLHIFQFQQPLKKINLRSSNVIRISAILYYALNYGLGEAVLITTNDTWYTA